MSISATRPSVLSGGASKYGASRSRSATHSGLWRSAPNCSASDGSAGCVPTSIVASGYLRRRRPVLEGQLSRLAEERVDHNPLRRRQDHRVDELLALAAAAVSADELDPRSWQRNVEHARVRGVGQVEANDLPGARDQREVGLAPDQDDVAEPPHGRVVGLGAAERRDPAVLDQDIVERQQHLAMHRWPVIRVGRDDEDVPVQPHLLAVVLANVRVVPVDAGIGELDAVRKRLAGGDRCLCLVCAVVAVVEAQAVPMHRRVESRCRWRRSRPAWSLRDTRSVGPGTEPL